MDFIHNIVLLTLSYSRVLVKYQKAIEPCILEVSAIKRRDEEWALAEAEKIRRKIGSGKYV